MKRSAGAIVLVLALTGAFTPVSAQPTGAQDVLVRFASGVEVSAAHDLLAATGATAVGTVYGDDVLIVRAPDVPAGSLVQRLERSPLVEYAEPDLAYRILLDAPDDPRFEEQYALERIKALEGWGHYPGAYVSTGGPTIAIIDTGIDPNHEDLTGRIDTQNSNCFLGLLCLFGGWNDDHGHGTHVAGIAAASTDNTRGIAGVAFNTDMMALKVCNVLGSCNTSAVASAINWAAERGAKVVNMSLGGSGESTTLRNAVENAWSQGVVLVAASGNSGDSTKMFPASFPEVISVAATDADDERASFSTFNEEVELAAPGVGVLSTWPGNRYRSLSGTSMASPHVAGLAALLFGQNGGWTNEEVRDRMASCADDLGSPGRNVEYGHGRINLDKALGSC